MAFLTDRRKGNRGREGDGEGGLQPERTRALGVSWGKVELRTKLMVG